MAETAMNQRGKTVVLRCSCKHEYQDTKYKKGMRVHNIGKDKVTCTVCGDRKSR